VIIVIIDFELLDYVCEPILNIKTMEPINEEQLKEYLSWMDKENIKKWLLEGDSEIYFANVRDETWNKYKTKNSKRLELTLDELEKLLKKALHIILIKGNRIEECMYQPEEDDP